MKGNVVNIDFRFVSNATDHLSDEELEEMVSLFAHYADCAQDQVSLIIKTRRSLNYIFGKYSKYLTTQYEKANVVRAITS